MWSALQHHLMDESAEMIQEYWNIVVIHNINVRIQVKNSLTAHPFQ